MAAEATQSNLTSRWDGGQVSHESGWAIVPANNTWLHSVFINQFFEQIEDVNRYREKSEVLTNEVTKKITKEAISSLTSICSDGAQVFAFPNDAVHEHIRTEAQLAYEKRLNPTNSLNLREDSVQPESLPVLKEPPVRFAKEIRQKNMHLAPQTNISRLLGKSGHPSIGNDDL